MRTKKEMFREAKSLVADVKPEEVQALLNGNGSAPAVVVDIREKNEVELGHVPGARFVPKSHLESQVEEKLPDRKATVILYCATGVRSLFAGRTLKEMGYEDVRNLAGGFEAWKARGLPVQKPVRLTDWQKMRYSRHLLIPEVGEVGQAKLIGAKVLLIGAGGLGSPAALYLAAAGVGTLGLVDMDVVDESNLQRQILHTTDRVGTPKTESARIALKALNPEVNVVEHRVRLERENALELFKPYDLVVDGCDNFATRYLVNDACVILGKPNVHGSIFRFDGQATTFVPGQGPCYRCLFPEPPPPEFAPSCNEAGVLGVLPGVIGVIQAIEAVKVIIGKGEPLLGRLLVYDALGQRFKELKYRRDPQCAACGDVPMKVLADEYTDIACPVRAPHAVPEPRAEA